MCTLYGSSCHMAEAVLEQRHGKARVRLARVWRGDRQHHVVVEWTISISLSSDCLPAYSLGDNSSIVATDSMKNTVYALAKECKEPLSMERFGILLGCHFLKTYKEVTGAQISIVENPWERISIDGSPHEHGFRLGSQKRMAEIFVSRDGEEKVLSGFTDLSLLKTTKVLITHCIVCLSGFEGFIRDKYTLLPEVKERLLASTVTAKWSFSSTPSCYTTIYNSVMEILINAFFGPSSTGVYSPSVQNTLYLMAQNVLQRIPEINSIHLNMPNIHFLPVNLPSIGVEFNHDVYMPTSEPHGTIEACLTRQGSSTSPRLTSKL